VHHTKDAANAASFDFVIKTRKPTKRQAEKKKERNVLFIQIRNRRTGLVEYRSTIPEDRVKR
jgi:hypothetical protein